MLTARIPLEGGDTLVAETHDKTMTVSRITSLYNKIYSRTKSYMKTKQALRKEYHIFLFIEPQVKDKKCLDHTQDKTSQ